MHEGVRRRVAFASMLMLVVASLLAPSAALAAPRPGESCPDRTPAPGTSEAVCGEGTNPGGNPGGGSVDIAALLPIIGAVAVGGALALGAAFIVLRRRAAVPAAPADPGEWWTCSNCGSNNVIGTPRCYACGSWQA
jgi:hypothetical protein